jgi:hypothetical protein
LPVSLSISFCLSFFFHLELFFQRPPRWPIVKTQTPQLFTAESRQEADGAQCRSAPAANLLLSIFQRRL